MVGLLFIFSGHPGPRALSPAGRTHAATLRAHPVSLGVPPSRHPVASPCVLQVVEQPALLGLQS
jgi:hypothetical protein